MNNTFENNIIRRVRQGETDAFTFLVKRYEKPLFIMVANMAAEKCSIEDIVQDTLLSAYQHLKTYDPNKGHFSTWLFRIARNKCLNVFNRKKEVLMETLPDMPDSETPASLMEKKEMFLKLDAALNRLSFRDRLIFVLAEFNELSYSEIASIENIRIGTVKSRLHRTRKKLRRILSEKKG